MTPDFAVLTVDQMYRADALAMAAGISGERLMEAAGWAVAHALWTRFKPCRVLVLCGPGNNGGDGFVAARLLQRRGYAVQLALLGALADLKGDAALVARRWRGLVQPFSIDLLARADVVVDAVFGAGLCRPLTGLAADLIAHLKQRKLPVVAVDVPSGVDGDSGQVSGDAAPATVTVTFFRKKMAHLLLPGRELCGQVVVADIGIPAAVLDHIGPSCFENHPDLWADAIPQLGPASHKYHRGHALLFSGAAMTGAIRLAAMAARRAGAGLVTIAAPPEALGILRGAEAGNIVVPLDQGAASLNDARYSAGLIGPGAGVTGQTRDLVGRALACPKSWVLDADALTAFADRPQDLFRMTNDRVVMTPHLGEFRRLWGELTGDKVSLARQAAAQSGAVIVLKGADTVIAHPDGRAIINGNAPPDLATAGSGDVLAGLVVGLLAQGLDGFTAAAMAVWGHGVCGKRAGKGLIAEDLIDGSMISTLFVTK